MRPEIVKALQDRGWRLTANAREVVRSTMIRKPDVFKRVSEGVYALVEWPSELKQERSGGDVAPVSPEQRLGLRQNLKSAEDDDN